MIPISEAAGLRLSHDLTEVNPVKQIKQRLFKRGHLVTAADIDRLRDIGKNHMYVWEDNPNVVHEDDAALTVSPLMAGKNIEFDDEPKEGKINFYATCDGLFNVDIEKQYQINVLEIPSLPTIHNRFPVRKNQQVAAFRIIPLYCECKLIDRIVDILTQPIIQVIPYLNKEAGVIVTGSEVYEGRIQDKFLPKITKILKGYGVSVTQSVVLPDDRTRIQNAVEVFSQSCQIILVTGGTSIDPDDQTFAALLDAGVKCESKGNPIQPGNNLSIGYRGSTIVCAVPAAALFFKATALDIFLPRLLAGETVSKEDIIRAGHGGLCLFCETCHFPRCPFAVGK